MRLVLPEKMNAGRNPQRGMSLIELMIAMVVLAIGLGGITTLLVIGIGTNNRNSKDTTATMLAQLVIEEIGSQDPNSGILTIPITDCAGNAFNIAVTGGAGPAGTGAALVTNAALPNYGSINQGQAVGAIPAGYQMNYVACSAAGGSRVTYDVRWNVMTITAGNSRLVTASARQVNSSSTLLGGPIFALPVNLRGIGGHSE
jgi:prepilin-type N-terminal cleavage/methylation domain-containing protein